MSGRNGGTSAGQTKENDHASYTNGTCRKIGSDGRHCQREARFRPQLPAAEGQGARATEENIKDFETRKAQLEAQNLELKSDAKAVGTKMNGATVILVRQAGEAGQLYGSVNARDIAQALNDKGFIVGRNQVRLDQPIKTLGLHNVSLTLHPEVSVNVTANVARSEDEAQIQTETGRALLSQAEEEALAEAAEVAADVAVAEQAETMFEEGAAPEATPDDSADDAAQADDTPTDETADGDEAKKVE